MKVSCPKCQSEYLDQGTDGNILCHKCKGMYVMVATWVVGMK